MRLPPFELVRMHYSAPLILTLGLFLLNRVRSSGTINLPTQHIAGLGEKAVLARNQEADHLALGDADAEATQQRNQPRHRHLPLMVLGEHEAAQLRPEVTSDAGRQSRKSHRFSGNYWLAGAGGFEPRHRWRWVAR